MDNHYQTAAVTPGQLTKTALNNLVRSTHKAPACNPFISKIQAQEECLRRAEAYTQIIKYSGSIIIACLVFVVLVKLME